VPNFAGPFAGNVEKKMDRAELVRAIMLDIAAELEATFVYLAHRDARDDEDARKVLMDIAQEELLHAGQFTSLLYRLDAEAGKQAQAGFEEASQLLKSKAPFEVTPSQ